LLDDLEHIANTLSDSDRHWWPFVFLRPPREVRISTARSALLAVLYGVFAGVLGNLLLALVGKRLSPWLLPVGVTLGCFVAIRLLTATFWNRRAARLARGRPPGWPPPDHPG